jgi:hypothetical protein
MIVFIDKWLKNAVFRRAGDPRQPWHAEVLDPETYAGRETFLGPCGAVLC